MGSIKQNTEIKRKDVRSIGEVLDSLFLFIKTQSAIIKTAAAIPVLEVNKDAKNEIIAKVVYLDFEVK